MNRNFNLLTLLVGLSSANQAAVPPPEKLLPADTLGVITVPDYAKARAAYEANASSQLWRDPAMKPFTEKLMKKVNEEYRVVAIDRCGIAAHEANQWRAVLVAGLPDEGLPQVPERVIRLINRRSRRTRCSAFRHRSCAPRLMLIPV